MNKELEALKELKWLHNQDFKVNGWNLNGDLEPLNNFLDNFYEDVVKSLTPPTADEVCEALSEHFKRYSGYDEQTKRFYFYDGLSTYNYITTWGLYGYKIDIYLPPHIITLIGRFYEGEIE